MVADHAPRGGDPALVRQGRGKLLGTVYGALSRAAVHYYHEHPEVTFNTNAVLHRIERHLSALVEMIADETRRKAILARWIEETQRRPGPLTWQWLSDVQFFAEADTEAAGR